MKKLTTGDFDYDLPGELIAQTPLGRRDQSRLMVLRRCDGGMSHHLFDELPALLRAGDLLALNDTKVIPARFFAVRAGGGRIEGLFLREPSEGLWEAMLKNASRCRPGEALTLNGAKPPAHLRLLANLGQGRWTMRLEPPRGTMDVLEQAGSTPLPPYIRRAKNAADPADRDRYQTVYASSAGAVAAPTAGLHFTHALLRKLADNGVEQVSVTLHVGAGTFTPVKCDAIADHKMHAEWYELAEQAAGRLNRAAGDGRRIVAVGTTSVRVLETAARDRSSGGGPEFVAGSGWTDIFIHPPAEFHAVGAMITNFHLPRSTLLMLVAAFCSPGGVEGIDMIRRAYAEAIRQRYRFYSYGDAMLII